jgi:methylmalonyl-CoA mutase
VFSGAVGGANSLSVLPHTYSHGLPDASARRIARNTHLVLKDESMLGFVDDPVAGSGSIEQLTAALCAAAWAQFQQLESEGGVLRSLAANLFQKRIGAMAEKRSKQYQDNVQSVIGTNVFPIKDERPVTVLSATKHQPKMQAAFNCDVLVPISIVSSFGSAQQ